MESSDIQEEEILQGSSRVSSCSLNTDHCSADPGPCFLHTHSFLITGFYSITGHCMFKSVNPSVYFSNRWEIFWVMLCLYHIIIIILQYHLIPNPIFKFPCWSEKCLLWVVSFLDQDPNKVSMLPFVVMSFKSLLSYDNSLSSPQKCHWFAGALGSYILVHVLHLTGFFHSVIFNWFLYILYHPWKKYVDLEAVLNLDSAFWGKKYFIDGTVYFLTTHEKRHLNHGCQVSDDKTVQCI